MRDAIIESKILQGKSKTDVFKTIGSPEVKDSTGIWKYDLGMSSAGFGLQFNFLELTFSHDKVSTVNLIEVID